MPSLKRSSDALTFTNGTRGWKSIDIHVVHVYIDKQRVWSLISQSNIKCQGFSDFLQFLWCFLSLSFHRKPLFHQCLLDRDVHWSDSTQYHVPSCPSKDPSRHASSYCGGPHEQIPLLGRLRTDPQNRASFSRRFQPDRAGFLGHRHPQRPGFGPPRWIHLLGGRFPGHDRTSPTRGGRDRGRYGTGVAIRLRTVSLCLRGMWSGWTETWRKSSKRANSQVRPTSRSWSETTSTCCGTLPSSTGECSQVRPTSSITTPAWSLTAAALTSASPSEDLRRESVRAPLGIWLRIAAVVWYPGMTTLSIQQKALYDLCGWIQRIIRCPFLWLTCPGHQ